MEADIEMSLTKEILAALPQTQDDAMSSQEIFEVCKGAEDKNQIAKLLSGLFIAKKIHRTTNALGRSQYWLAQKTSAHTTEVLSVMASASKPITEEKEMHIPQFLLKTDEVATDESVNEKPHAYQKMKDIQEEILADYDEVEQLQNKIDKFDEERFAHLSNTPFKVAITSDGTIMLFGVQYIPVELTPAQSKILCDFIGNADLEGLMV